MVWKVSGNLFCGTKLLNFFYNCFTTVAIKWVQFCYFLLHPDSLQTGEITVYLTRFSNWQIVNILLQRTCEIPGFTCHSDGSSALVYAPQHQTIISCGKKGDVCLFDVRQRQLRHTFHAHDSTIKCMALDPMEQFFVTGSADGDIKVR